MRTLTLSASAALVLAATAAATPAAAQRYVPPGTISQECQQSLNNNRLTGAALGAGLGAVAGSNVASRGRRTEGAVLGAVLGAVAGRAVAGNRLACDDAAYNQDRRAASYGQPQYGARDRFYNPGGYAPDYRQPAHNPYAHGYQGGYREQPYQASYAPPREVRGSCGWGEARYVTPDGGVTRQDVYMCQDRGGAWVIQP